MLANNYSFAGSRQNEFLLSSGSDLYGTGQPQHRDTCVQGRRPAGRAGSLRTDLRGHHSYLCSLKTKNKQKHHIEMFSSLRRLVVQENNTFICYNWVLSVNIKVCSQPPRRDERRSEQRTAGGLQALLRGLQRAPASGACPDSRLQQSLVFNIHISS